VAADSTSAGFEALAQGRAEIAMAARRATDDERVMVLRAGLGDPAADGNATVVALQGVVVVVNKDNAIGILTLDQIRRLFSGQIGNWSALGGRDLPVTIYRRDQDSSSADLALGSGKMSPTAVVSESLADAVAADPGGIGFAGFDEIGGAKPITIALACGITVAPTPFNVRTEEYPLARRLYLYAETEKPALVHDFLHFATSGAAQPIVRRAGLIDLAPELDAPGDAMPRPSLWEPAEVARRRAILGGITQSLTGARRLSTTYRFEADGTTLDARALADVARVASWKKANPGHKLILVGYWSGPGSFDANLALSAKRAQEAASALAAAGAAPDQVLAGSTLRPIACDDDPRSDRVEVWVR
jgi:phosphate transport system substrate-binding protein